jgi:hypothetical protein
MENRYGKIRVVIKGRTPILMNRLTPERLKEQQEKGRKTTKKYDPEEEARQSAYIDVIDGKETLYIPNIWLYRSILNASKVYKSGKYRLTELLAGSIRIEPEKIPLGTNKYEVDIQPVNIQGSKVLRARARVDNWKAEFYIIYDKTLLSNTDLIKSALEEAGLRVGIGDYRPQRGGWYGTFDVVEFEDVKKTEKKSD